MTIWFTSDTHFCHSNIIHFCKRPFKDVYAMNNAMIDRWNECVGETDDVYHLGDFVIGGHAKHDFILPELNGNIHLIKGNHDVYAGKQWFEDYFVWVKDYHEMHIPDEDAFNGKKQHIVMSHFPRYSWHQGHSGSWMLHGHCHGNINDVNKTTTRIDVGADNFGLKPINYEELKCIMVERDFTPVDHHGVF